MDLGFVKLQGSDRKGVHHGLRVYLALRIP